jgi:secreted PhoX family phosphatase
MSRRATLHRRAFLARAGAAAIALAGPLAALLDRQAHAAGLVDGPYGRVRPARDRATGLELLHVPPGFEYTSFGWTGDPLDDGSPTPPRHDGMAVVEARRRGRDVVLIRNHENGIGPLIGGGRAPTYDRFAAPPRIPGLGGGTTGLVFDLRRFEVKSMVPTLAGTLTNCAGGPSPWGSWLTCEEAVVAGERIGAQRHGYVYEVPSPFIAAADPTPIIGMGLMNHEALAIDPRTGSVYLTEDVGPVSGLYRFSPTDRRAAIGALAKGGTLEMLAVRGRPQADLRNPAFGLELEAEWVPVENPDLLPATEAPPPLPDLPPITFLGESGPYVQGIANGGASFARLEGCWFHDGVIYFTDTTAGPVGAGVVWALQPASGTGRAPAKGDLLTAIFVSEHRDAAANPDNITVSPAGEIFVSEDGFNPSGTRVLGINRDGSSFELVRNNVDLTGVGRIPGKPTIESRDYRAMELAGVTFDPTGRVLFVNLQTPGITFAIAGPFERG